MNKNYLNKPLIVLQCSCGHYDYATKDELCSGKKRGCGKCVFNMTPSEREKAIASYKLKHDTSKQQLSLYDI